MGKSSHSSQNVAQPTPPVASTTASTASRNLAMTRSFPFRIWPARTDLGQVPPAVHGAAASSGKTGRFALPAQQSRPIVCYVHRPASPRTMSRTRTRVQVHPTGSVVQTTGEIALLGSRVPPHYNISVSRGAVRVNADDLISDPPPRFGPIRYCPVLHGRDQCPRSLRCDRRRGDAPGRSDPWRGPVTLRLGGVQTTLCRFDQA